MNRPARAANDNFSLCPLPRELQIIRLYHARSAPWKARNVSAGVREKSFQFYAAKDREIARQAELGLMIWDGKSPGTVLNVLRLVRASKKAVLVSVAEKSEIEFTCKEDWDSFLSRCSLKLRRDMEKRAIQDELFMLRPEQNELDFGETDELPDVPGAN